MNWMRRSVLLTGMMLFSNAWSQAYPTGPITLVVPLAAGSGTDAVARAVAQKLS